MARGAGTGLSGGALPVEGGLLLVLSRLEPHPRSRSATRRLARVQPGVTNLAISEAAAPHGLFYAPDPSSQVACTIGGNVAENSGGVHCLKYGLTVHNLLEVRLATCDGELAHARLARSARRRDSSLLPLLTGSEGMLGVVVEVTVRLRAAARTRRTAAGRVRRRRPLRRRRRPRRSPRASCRPVSR